VAEQTEDPTHIRPDLAETLARHDVGLDSARPTRWRGGARSTAAPPVRTSPTSSTPARSSSTARCHRAAASTPGSLDDLIARTPADGMIGGIGTVNGDLFDTAAAQVVAMSYDYTVLAGTQGTQNHRKKDRLFEMAEQLRLPVVFFTEGGGGRPGDTDRPA
jgi:hypothetical protein